MIKMIATDIDGTILKWGLNFTPELKNCIKNLSSNGIKVVLVTGRMHIAAMPVARELGLNTPIISYQGGLIKISVAKPYTKIHYPQSMPKRLYNGHAKTIFT